VAAAVAEAADGAIVARPDAVDAVDGRADPGTGRIDAVDDPQPTVTSATRTTAQAI
jgi:hypothetical protein